MLEINHITPIVHKALRELQFRYKDQYSDEETLIIEGSTSEYHVVAMWDDNANLWKLNCYIANEPICIGAISMDIPEDDVIRMMSTIICDLENYKD